MNDRNTLFFDGDRLQFLEQLELAARRAVEAGQCSGFARRMEAGTVWSTSSSSDASPSDSSIACTSSSLGPMCRRAKVSVGPRESARPVAGSSRGAAGTGSERSSRRRSSVRYPLLQSQSFYGCLEGPCIDPPAIVPQLRQRREGGRRPPSVVVIGYRRTDPSDLHASRSVPGLLQVVFQRQQLLHFVGVGRPSPGSSSPSRTGRC